MRPQRTTGSARCCATWGASTRRFRPFAARSSSNRSWRWPTAISANCCSIATAPRKRCRTVKKPFVCNPTWPRRTTTWATYCARWNGSSKRESFAEALRLDPDLVPALANLGLTLQREGRINDALPWLEQAVAARPENASWRERLGDLRMEREEYGEAARCYEHVVALQPDNAPAHNSLGWALQEAGRLAEAAECYRTALRLSADFAGAQLNLGGIHEELGELTEAETAFRASLRMQPRFAVAHGRLATLLRDKLPDADLAALEERLADPNIPGEPRANLLFGLAQALRRPRRIPPRRRMFARSQRAGARARRPRTSRLRSRPARAVRQQDAGCLRRSVFLAHGQ